MLKNKKWIIIGVVAAVVVLVAGVVGGAVAFAQSPLTSANNPQKAFADRVAGILGIDPVKVENAFSQAQKDTQNEAMTNRLKSLVDQNKITQQQADQYSQWWASRPNVPGQLGPGGPMGFGGGFRGMHGRGKLPVSPTPTPSPSTSTGGTK